MQIKPTLLILEIVWNKLIRVSSNRVYIGCNIYHIWANVIDKWKSGRYCKLCYF